MSEFTSSHTITLAEPIMRGEMKIESITVNKPNAGQLRGLSLQNLLGLDITSILEITPRITMPPLTTAEADQLSPSDLAEIGGAIRDFFMTRAERAILQAMIDQHTPKP